MRCVTISGKCMGQMNVRLYKDYQQTGHEPSLACLCMCIIGPFLKSRGIRFWAHLFCVLKLEHKLYSSTIMSPYNNINKGNIEIWDKISISGLPSAQSLLTKFTCVEHINSYRREAKEIQNRTSGIVTEVNQAISVSFHHDCYLLQDFQIELNHVTQINCCFCS